MGLWVEVSSQHIKTYNNLFLMSESKNSNIKKYRCLMYKSIYGDNSARMGNTKCSIKPNWSLRITLIRYRYTNIVKKVENKEVLILFIFLSSQSNHEFVFISPVRENEINGI